MRRREAVYGRPGAGHIESMAILKIARMGHPVLSRPALPVANPAAPAIARLIEDMVDTLVDANGAGLAAPQVHVPLRLVLFRVPPGREAAEDEDGEDNEAVSESGLESPTVLINPAIEPIGESMVEDMEACLSLPGLAGMVPATRSHPLSLDGYRRPEARLRGAGLPRPSRAARVRPPGRNPLPDADDRPLDPHLHQRTGPRGG